MGGYGAAVLQKIAAYAPLVRSAAAVDFLNVIKDCAVEGKAHSMCTGFQSTIGNMAC
jgi:hypothetical protein